jgi:AraC-like DNA-binding protein
MRVANVASPSIRRTIGCSPGAMENPFSVIPLRNNRVLAKSRIPQLRGCRQNIHPPHHIVILMGTPPPRPHETHSMRIINHDSRVISLRQIANLLQRLIPALTLADARLNNPQLSIAELAASMNIIEVYFRKLFLSATGTSPVRYLHQLRIKKAKHLIRGNNLPMKTIAESFDCSTLPFFYRVFRNVIGTTPRAFKDHSLLDM